MTPLTLLLFSLLVSLPGLAAEPPPTHNPRQTTEPAKTLDETSPRQASDAPPSPATAVTLDDLRKRTTGHDWPRFLGPTGDGKSDETGLRLTWPATGPTLTWWRPTGEGYSMPSISKGRLFLFDRQGHSARLTCLESETGRPLWQQTYTTDYEDLYGYSNGPRTSPLVDDDRVYTFGAEGKLRCHRVSDGKLLWQVDTAKTFGVVQNFFGVGSSPVIEGDVLIAQVGGSPTPSPPIHSGEVQGDNSGIVAFDKLTGALRYRFSDELASYATPTLVTIGERRWGFAFTRGGLLAFEPSQGKQDFFYPWRAKKLESVNASSPVVVDDTVFISESYGPGSSLLKVRPGSYEVLWKDGRRNQAMASHWTTPIHHQGYFYGCSGQSGGDATLRCIDRRTGEVQWSQPGLGRSTLLYVDNHFIVLTEYGRLLVIEATPDAFRQVAGVDLGDGKGASPKTPVTAAAKDRPRLRFPAWNAPILAHGFLYVRGKDQLLAFDLLPPTQEAAADRSDRGVR